MATNTSLFIPQQATKEQVMLGKSKKLQKNKADNKISGWKKFSLAAEGVGALGGLVNSAKQNKLAQTQFNFQRDFANRQYDAQNAIVKADRKALLATRAYAASVPLK